MSRMPTAADYEALGLDPEAAARAAAGLEQAQAEEFDGAAYLAGLREMARKSGRARLCAAYFGASRCERLPKDVRDLRFGQAMSLLDEMPDLDPEWLARNTERWRVRLVDHLDEVELHTLPGDRPPAPNEWGAGLARMIMPFVAQAIAEIRGGRMTPGEVWRVGE